MRKRPIIGIPTQTLQSLGGVSADIPPSWVMSQRYVGTLVEAGAVPWLLPLVDEETLRVAYDALDGVFLPGGADIDPAAYGQATHRSCDRSDPARDRVEISLARWALRDGKPMLGVCRGLQLINVAAGGTLVQDLGALRPDAIKHDFFPYGGTGHRRDYLAHEVRIQERSRIARILGASTIRVNSMHHQGIADLGAGLVATAWAPDGLIEGLEGAGEGYLVAVQWHPESLTESDAGARRLFADFVEHAADGAVVPR